MLANDWIEAGDESTPSNSGEALLESDCTATACLQTTENSRSPHSGTHWPQAVPSLSWTSYGGV